MTGILVFLGATEIDSFVQSSLDSHSLNRTRRLFLRGEHRLTRLFSGFSIVAVGFTLSAMATVWRTVSKTVVSLKVCRSAALVSKHDNWYIALSGYEIRFRGHREITLSIWHRQKQQRDRSRLSHTGDNQLI